MSREEACDIVNKENNRLMLRMMNIDIERRKLKGDIEEHCLRCESSMTMFIKKLMCIVPVGCKRCSLYKYKRIRESVAFCKNAQEFLS